MAKWQNDAMLDAALNYLKNNAGTVTVCNAQPTTNAEAITTFALADVAVDSSDLTVGNGDTSGRKVTVGAQAAVLIDTSGTATHIALTGAGTLLYVTTCTSQALIANGSNTVDIPAFDIEIADAA